MEAVTRKGIYSHVAAGCICGIVLGASLMALIANIYTNGDFTNLYVDLVGILAGGIVYPLTIIAAVHEITDK